MAPNVRRLRAGDDLVVVATTDQAVLGEVEARWGHDDKLRWSCGLGVDDDLGLDNCQRRRAGHLDTEPELLHKAEALREAVVGVQGQHLAVQHLQRPGVRQAGAIWRFDAHAHLICVRDEQLLSQPCHELAGTGTDDLRGDQGSLRQLHHSEALRVEDVWWCAQAQVVTDIAHHRDREGEISLSRLAHAHVPQGGHGVVVGAQRVHAGEPRLQHRQGARQAEAACEGL
mmetsp:Transcript_3720/g.9619  ORF Transcript_3720/g.9619 Transcript_3720/m.9619 type:complete len:228 (+) Transcript_3720:1321-2004(+)